MSEEAVLLSAFILLMSLSLAWLVHWSGPRFAGWSRRRARLTAGGFAIGGLIAAIFAYTTSTAIDSRTLFEARLKGNPETRDGDPVVTRALSFSVEHPHTRHSLGLSPRKAPGQGTIYPVTVNVRLWENADAKLIDTQHTFEPQERTSTDRHGRRLVYWEWDSADLDFTPTDYGLHYIEVDYLNVGTPDFYLRIEDPKKTDGRRDMSLR
jgi:hypothetical protein